MGIPYLIGEIIQIFFWSSNNTINTIDTTKYLFFAYAIFFIVVVGIFIPLARKVFIWLQIVKINPFDSIGSVMIFLASFIPLIVLSKVTIFLLKRKFLEKHKYRIFNFAVSAALFLLGVRVRYKGKRDLGAKIVISNHTSPLDYALITQSMGIYPFNILAGINLSYNGRKMEDKIVKLLLGYFVKNYAISVDRRSRASREAAYRRMVKEVGLGIYIGIFPEGTRNPKAQIEQGILTQEFKNGAFQLAWDTGECIQPVVYDLAVIWKGKDDQFWGIRPCRIKAHWLKSVNPKDFVSVDHLKRYCQLIVQEKLSESKNVRNFLKNSKN